MDQGTHIVLKQELELIIAHEGDSHEIQEKAAQLYRNEIYPRIDRWLSNLQQQAGHSLRLDRLELDLGEVSFAHFEEEFLAKLDHELQKATGHQAEEHPLDNPEILEAFLKQQGALSTAYPEDLAYPNEKQFTESSGTNPNTEQRREMSEKARQRDLFLYFIQTGNYPWWVKETGAEAFLTALRSLVKNDGEWLQYMLKEYLIGNKQIQKRFQNSLSIADWHKVIKLYLPTSGAEQQIRQWKQALLSLLEAGNDKEKLYWSWKMQQLAVAEAHGEQDQQSKTWYVQQVRERINKKLQNKSDLVLVDEMNKLIGATIQFFVHQEIKANAREELVSQIVTEQMLSEVLDTAVRQIKANPDRRATLLKHLREHVSLLEDNRYRPQNHALRQQMTLISQSLNQANAASDEQIEAQLLNWTKSEKAWTEKQDWLESTLKKEGISVSSLQSIQKRMNTWLKALNTLENRRTLLQKINPEKLWYEKLKNIRDKQNPELEKQLMSLVKSWQELNYEPAYSLLQRMFKKLSQSKEGTFWAAIQAELTMDQKQNKKQENTAEKQTPELQTDPFSQTDKLYVDQAGLVLLWPMMKHFFELNGLLEGNEFKNEEARDRACCLLYYLSAEKGEKIFEAGLSLCKILVGKAPEEPVEILHKLTRQERRLITDLIAVNCSRLPAWKNLDQTAFRQAWLRREGAISAHDGNYSLEVKRETYDILLDQLAWSIGMIKLPWMKQLLVVTWR